MGTTAGPGPDTTTSVTQGAQSSAPAVTTTTENSSSSLLWLWILLGILALCCLLSLCGGGLAACMGGDAGDADAGDADGRALSFGDAHDGSDSDAGDRRVWSAILASNEWRRLRNASAARSSLI